MREENLKTKYLVIGAGVTGLSFVNFIKDDYLIIEKENEVGGFCRTIYKDNYVWDYAGHFFHFSNEKIKKYFLDNINKSELIFKEKNTKIYCRDTFVDYPFQKNIHQLPKSDFINCLYDLFNKIEKEKYTGFLDMLFGKFGKSITNYFLQPYNEKLYACDLNKLDVDAMGRFFPYADIKDIINNMKNTDNSSYNNSFLYPKKGAKVFIDRLVNNIKKEKLLLNEEVINIDIDRKVVYTSKNREIEYEILINTSPFSKFLEYFKEKYQKILQEFTYNKVLVFNLGFDKKSDIRDLHWLYLPDKNINFYRIGFYDNILDSDKLSMYIEIGFSKDEKIDVEKELKNTLENLKKLKIITNHKLCAYSTIIMEPAYVHISKISNELKEKIKKELEKNNIYTIGRYGDWKYCSIEDSVIDSLKLSKKLLNMENK